MDLYYTYIKVKKVLFNKLQVYEKNLSKLVWYLHEKIWSSAKLIIVWSCSFKLIKCKFELHLKSNQIITDLH